MPAPTPPSPAAAFARAELVLIVTGHGWGVDVQNCLEFCPQSHVFEVEGCGEVAVDLREAGVRGACALHVEEGVVPNQFGQWTSGRSNWFVTRARCACCMLPRRSTHSSRITQVPRMDGEGAHV